MRSWLSDLLHREFHNRIAALIQAEKFPPLATCSITEPGFVRVLAQAPDMVSASLRRGPCCCGSKRRPPSHIPYATARGSASQEIRERPRLRDTISRTVPFPDRQLRSS